MSDTANLVEITNDVQFVYVTIPKEYICVYHKILVMLADYGIDMLKDCKASCTERNSGVIECFNMFNAAVAAYKLGKDTLANTLITYVKAKIEQIYKSKVDTNFILSIDENDKIKSFITCEDEVKMYIDAADHELFTNTFVSEGFINQQKLINTVDEEKPFNYTVHYSMQDVEEDNVVDPTKMKLTITISNIEDKDGNEIDLEDCVVNWTLAGQFYTELNNVIVPKHSSSKLLNIVVYYNNVGIIQTTTVSYESNRN